MNFSRLSHCGNTAGKILTAAALLFAFCTQMPAQTEIQSPVNVGPDPLPNAIPAGVIPTAPTLIQYSDPIPPQLWLWNNAESTLPTLRLQSAAVTGLPAGGSLWGLARPGAKLSTLACIGGNGPDVVFKADGDVKHLVITNLGRAEGGIRFATTVKSVGPDPVYTEKQRLFIHNNGDATFFPDQDGRVHVSGHLSWTGELRPNSDPGTSGQILISQGIGQPPVWSSELPGGGSEANPPWLTTGNDNTNGSNFLGTTVLQPLIVKTNNTERMRITDDGRVGIGTNDPQRPFEVKSWGQVVGQFTGETQTTLDILSTANTGAGEIDGNALIRFLNQSGSTLHGSWMAGMDAEDDYKFKIAPLVSSEWLGASTFVIQPDGKIGIGTNDPKDNLHVWGKTRIGEKGVTGTHSDYKLAVDGKIAAKELIILEATNWADFVFDEEYELMPLEEVAGSIKANKHLPGIPSAQEVRQNGVNILEMQAKLLQKIEELTLYVIEQQEKIKSLEERLK